MKRPLLAAVFTMVLTASAVHAQVRLLPPAEKPIEEPQKVQVLPQLLEKSGVTLIEQPPPEPAAIKPAPVQPFSLPHQLQGREPAHGKLPGGTAIAPGIQPSAVQTPALPPP